MQKKTYRACAAAGLLLGAALLTGCAKTPDSAVIRQKNAKTETEKTKETKEAKEAETNETGGTDAGESRTLAERLSVPDTYTAQVTAGDGTFTLTCDAQVEVPDVTGVSTRTVSQKKLDQDFIDRAVAALLKGTTIYDGSKYVQYSKTQITEKINELKERQANGEDLQDAIDSWEEIYADASDEIIKEEAEPELESEEDNMILSGYYIAEADDGTAYELSLADWSVSGYGIPMEITVSRRLSEGLQTGTDAYWFEPTAEYESTQAREDASEEVPTGEELEEKSGLSKEEAVAVTDGYVRDLGLSDFSAKRTAAAVMFLETEEEEAVARAVSSYAWAVEYTRDIDGVLITCESNDGAMVEEEDLTTSPWYYERLLFYVNADGLQYAKIQNIYELGEKKAENVSLLDFSEIASIFEQQMKLRNMDLEGVKQSSFAIDRVTFGYTRVYEPSKDNTTGILIPVWDFFGEKKVTTVYVNKDTGETEESSFGDAASNSSYLTINAMDGTVIDRGLGY